MIHNDDDIIFLNALEMPAEANELIGDCPECGTPKYHFEKVDGVWHCPKCESLDDSAHADNQEELDQYYNDHPTPDLGEHEGGFTMSESQLWFPNRRPVIEGYFDKRMADDSITGPAATSFAGDEEPEEKIQHESYMGVDGEWGIDEDIIGALGKQKIRENISRRKVSFAEANKPFDMEFCW
jgi:rubredoxin